MQAASLMWVSTNHLSLSHTSGLRWTCAGPVRQAPLESPTRNHNEASDLTDYANL